MVSSEVSCDRGDIIGVLVTATCQSHGWRGLQGPRAEVKRVRRQHKNQGLLCSAHTQPNFSVVTLFTELPQEFIRMVTKKGKFLQRIPIKYPSAVPFEMSLLLCPNKQ